jgi:hypothetical protein
MTQPPYNRHKAETINNFPKSNPYNLPLRLCQEKNKPPRPISFLRHLLGALFLDFHPPPLSLAHGSLPPLRFHGLIRHPNSYLLAIYLPPLPIP